MAPKVGTVFLLLVLACAVLAEPQDGMAGNKHDFKNMAKKMMRKCLKQGYPPPNMMYLKTMFNDSDLPMVERKSEQSDSLLSTFLKVLPSVFPERARGDGTEVDAKGWSASHLPAMIKKMRNSSMPSACYMQTFVAPLSWATLTTQSWNNMTSDDYDTMLWAAKPALTDMPSRRFNLPTSVKKLQRLKKMMEMLKEVHADLSIDQRTQVVKWGKEQIAQKDFNCTMRPPSVSRPLPMKRCKPSLEWLNADALSTMGPYISGLGPRDVDSSPKEQLCEFFRSAKFKNVTGRNAKMKPSVGKKFLQKYQECFSEKEEFANNADKLGILACHYSALPDLTPDLSSTLLTEINNCDDRVNPKIPRLKKLLVKSMMSNANSTEALHKLGSSVNLLSPGQLSEIPNEDLKELVKQNIQLKRVQQRTLVKKLLGEKLKSVSAVELMDLQSVAESLPISVLKNVMGIQNQKEGLKNILKRMRKGQRMAMLQGVLQNVAPSELVQKLPGPLLYSLPLIKLEKANIVPLEVRDKIWSLPQAAFLAKRMDLKKLRWRLYSVLQGVTCKMMNKVADNDTQEMVQAITETPQWLSKVQAGCAARKLFATLEKERADYFKDITEEEMTNIPTGLLLYLPPSKVEDLPDSVCPVFLDKMEEADLSSLPRRCPSRPSLIKRALRCLTIGTDLSGLTEYDVSRLGPLLCEIQPSQLRLMALDVLKSSLEAMASCQHIPQRYRADITQLVTQTFGDPSDWSDETMETLGPLLLWDDNAISALPNKPWMKDVLYSLKTGSDRPSETLRKKYFYLITNALKGARKKREASSSSNGKYEKGLTVEVIEELGMDNVYLTPAQIKEISAETFLTTLETLGSIPDYSSDQLAVLSEKATETLGPVPQMTESEVIQMGCITRGFSNTDLEILPFSLDSLEEIADCGWNESQMESLWKGVAKHDNLKAQQLGVAEVVALSQILCGLNTSEIRLINMDVFKDAVGAVGSVQCSPDVTLQLKSLAVSAFGNPNTWSEAQVSEQGNIIAGLDAPELASLDPSVFPFIRNSCIPLIAPLNLASLSVAQLEALGPDNAAMVTSEQQAALSDEQLAALERAVTGSPAQTQRDSHSGAASLRLEWIPEFLFLLTGVLLL